MFDRLFRSGSLPALETMLAYASARHRVLAANVANVDTLGYRTQDLPEADFHRALERALGAEAPPAGFNPGASEDAGPLKPGGNNVDLELEMSKIARNTLLHGTAAALVAQQFALLREAVSGHVSA